MKSDIFLGITRQKNEIAITDHTIRFYEIKIEELSKIDQSPDVAQEIARCNSMITLFGIVKKRQISEFEEAQRQLEAIMKQANDQEMEVFYRRYIKGMKITEIAVEMSYSEVHVKRICSNMSRQIQSYVHDDTFMIPSTTSISG